MILARPVGKNPGKVYTSGTLSKTSIDNTGQNFFMETDIYSRFSTEISKTSLPFEVDPGDCALITPPAKHNGIREPGIQTHDELFSFNERFGHYKRFVVCELLRRVFVKIG